MKIIHSRTSLIQPSVETSDKWIDFSYFDMTANHAYVLTGFLYKLELTIEQFHLFLNKLKDSLSEVLVPFYPMAGRALDRDNGQIGLLCNGKGAFLTEAHADGNISAIQDFNFSPISGMSADQLGSSGPVYAPGPNGLPALVVQVTFFRCGGIALAVNWHHGVADGYSAFHFMKSWAEVARGENISLAPIHERSLMAPREPPRVTIPMDKYYEIGENQLPPIPGQETIAKQFSFSKEAIAELVQVASEGRATLFTRAESMAGHIWRSIAKTRDLDPEDKIHFMSVVDGRKRFSNPPIPLGYFGNAICIARACSTVKDLLQEPLACAAKLVHDSYTGVTDEYLRSVIDWIALRGPQNVFKGRDRVVGRDIRLTFWTHFPIYELDFGWGFPHEAGPNGGFNPRWEGTAVVTPGPPGTGDMLARVYLHANCMEKLTRDPTFTLS